MLVYDEPHAKKITTTNYVEMSDCWIYATHYVRYLPKTV